MEGVGATEHTSVETMLGHFGQSQILFSHLLCSSNNFYGYPFYCFVHFYLGLLHPSSSGVLFLTPLCGMKVNLGCWCRSACSAGPASMLLLRFLLRG